MSGANKHPERDRVDYRVNPKPNTRRAVRQAGLKTAVLRYCGHSPLSRVDVGPNRNWYSAEVIKEQTMAC
jgi:hypothetical protein